MQQLAEFTPKVAFGLDPMWVSVGLLVVTYAVIISEKVNRAIIALLGAGLMIIAGILDQEEAIKGVDFNTIALLTGMFQYVAIWAAKISRAKPWAILAVLSAATAILSALLDNVTTVLLIVPVTLAITKELEVPPYPFLFAEIFASNIGGTATLIGDPPNILIGSLANLSFNQFVLNLAPIIVVILLVQMAMIHILWGGRMHATPAARARIMGMVARETITDWKLLRQSLVVLGLVMVAFVLARTIHLEPGTIAMFGAGLLMLLHNIGHHAEHQSKQVTETFGEVEWITIFFFVGLFMVVHGVEIAGFLKMLANMLTTATGGDLQVTAYAILWVSAVLSAIVDNIPFVATMIPLIKAMAPTFGGPDKIEVLWWALSLGACLGGNGTLIGASANLTVAGLAERSGIPFRFVTYTLYAFPMMLVSIAISHVYIWLRYF